MVVAGIYAICHLPKATVSCHYFFIYYEFTYEFTLEQTQFLIVPIHHFQDKTKREIIKIIMKNVPIINPNVNIKKSLD